MKKATLKDVASAAGVSPITVSRYVNTPDVVSDSARKKIEKAIDQVGYIPNAAARQLKTNESNTVFLIVPNIRNELYASLSHRLMLNLAKVNKSLFISDYNFQNDLEEIQFGEILKHRPSAIVMASGDYISEAQVLRLKTSRIPVIQFDRVNPAINSVFNITLDNFAGGELAAEYLLKQNMSKIYIYSAKTKLVFHSRIHGFLSRVKNSHVTVEVIEVDFSDDAKTQSVSIEEDAAYFILNSDLLDHFILNNLGKINALNVKNIIAFDKPASCKFLPFSIPSIEYDTEAFTVQICQKLEDVFSQCPTEAHDVVLPVHLAEYEMRL